MIARKISRRKILKTAALGTVGAGATFYGPWRYNRVFAAASDKPLLIGFTSDASGQFANSGASDRRGMLMAIGEFNDKGGVLGRKIETIHMDTETTPATGSRVAERMITRHEVAFLMGALSSGVAQAISQVAQKYGIVYLNTNSSSPSESGKNCHRTKFVWDGNGRNFAKAAVNNAIDAYGDKWLLLTNDYVWGHNTSAATRDLVTKFGGTITDELMVPQGTRDFTSYLLKIQQLKPDVVAAAVAGDDQKSMRQQVAEVGLGDKPVWLTNQQDWPDNYGLQIDSLFGVFGTTWYYKLGLPGVKEFVQRYRQTYPDTAMRSPGNVYYNGYMATRELLRAIERAGTTNNIKIIKELEGLKMPAEERMQHHDAWIHPETHQVQQTVYLARANDRAVWEKDTDDMFKIVARAAPDVVMDEKSLKACKLESYEDTPTYEQ